MGDETAELQGRTGVVTGAGSGIGRATTLRLVAAGATVIAVDIDADAVERLEKEHEGVIAYPADVTDPDQVAGYAADLAQHDRPYFLHNNAGVEGAHQRIVDLSVEEWDRNLAINLRSMFLGLKYVIPVLVAAGGGAIVNTGSVLSFRSAVRRADYTIPKFGVIGLTQTAAMEHAAEGVRVNAVCPGAINTPLNERSAELINPDDPDWEWHRLEDAAPVGRFGSPDEVAEVVAMLLSPRNSFMTGAAVAVDGGYMAS